MESARGETYLLGGRVVTQPGPSGTLDSESGRVDSLLQSIESTKVLVDPVSEGSRGRELSSSSRSGREVLPEERVVDVSSTVELDGGLESDRLLDVLGLNRSREFLGSLSKGKMLRQRRLPNEGHRGGAAELTLLKLAT